MSHESKADAPASQQTQEERELASLRKLWLVLAILALTMSVNVLLATQGGALKMGVKAIIGLELEKGTPEAIAALWGVIVLTLFVGSSSLVLLEHARRHPGPCLARYPFRTFDLPPGRGAGLASQVFAMLLLSAVPAYVLGHSWRVLTNYAALCIDPGHAQPRTLFAEAPARLFFVAPPPAGASIRLTSSEVAVSRKCRSGEAGQGTVTDYWLPHQSWIMAFLTGLATLAWLSGFNAVFRPADWFGHWRKRRFS